MQDGIDIGPFYQERRRYPRSPFDGPVNYRPLTGLPEEEVDAVGIDLSAGGVLFESPRPHPVGSALSLVVRLPAWFGGGEAWAVGRVVRCEPVEGGASHKVAVEFTTISDGDRRLLAEFVRTIAPPWTPPTSPFPY